MTTPRAVPGSRCAGTLWAAVALALLMPGAPLLADTSGPRFDQPPISPTPAADTASVPGGRIFARVILPIACAPPTLAVARVSFFGEAEKYLGATITLNFHRATVDCPTPARDTPMVVPLGVFTRPGKYSLELRDLDNGCCSPDDPAAGLVDSEVFDIAPAACEGLCLRGGQFEVTGQWTTGESSGEAHPSTLTSETGGLWFFSPDNVEVVVKVLDGCAVNDHWWVFVTGLTDVGVTLRVTDVEGHRQRTYTNARGHAFVPITDTRAFSCSTTHPPGSLMQDPRGAHPGAAR